jgi:hypothetical protein
MDFLIAYGEESGANYTFVVLSTFQNFGWRSFPARSPLTPPAQQALNAARVC